MSQRFSPRTLLALVAAALLLALCAPASAGGFASARFGGERGNPTEANPFSIYYNPGGLGLSTGTNLTIDSSLIFRSATYERPLADGVEAGSVEALSNSGTGSVDNFLISPALAISSDLGGSPVVIGAGFFVPFGGSAVWDTTDPVEGVPGAQDGPQRWYTIEGTIQSLAVAVGAAYKIEPLRLSFGLAGNVYLSKVETIRARNGDGSDDLAQEGRSFIDVSSTDIGLGVGMLWETIEDELWIGLSYQSQPGFGTMELEGNLHNALGAAQPSTSKVFLTQSLPDIVRLGGRYRASESLELRLFLDYTRWSTFTNQCLVNKDNADDLDASCSTNDDGTLADANAPQPIQVLQRRWEDTFGARVGASVWPFEGVEILLGAGFDSSAIPDETLEPALFDMNKFTGSVGVRYGFTDFMALTLTATNVFYLERDTTGAETAESLQLPSTQPSSTGIYNQNIFLLNANLDFMF